MNAKSYFAARLRLFLTRDGRPPDDISKLGRFGEDLQFLVPMVLHKWSVCLFFINVCIVNPRPAGVWIVTRPAGGGGGQRAPPEISQTTGPISKFQTPFDSPVRELPVQGQKFDLEVTDDATGQSQNFRLFGHGDIGE